MKVVVTGATGFVGRHLLQRLVSDGHQVVALVHRRPPPNGVPEGVAVVHGSIDDVGDLQEAFAGADAVWHLVGIIAETHHQTFERTVVHGTQNVVAACQAAGVRLLGYLSAMGTSAGAPSRYHQAKYAAEQAVLTANLESVILRPSVIYGPGDGFVSLLTKMINRSPIVPVIGDGRYRMQPVYIDDLTAVASRSLEFDEAHGYPIDVGGPEKLEYLEILDIIRDALGVRRAIVHIPLALVRPVVTVLEKIVKPSPLTLDQLTMMAMGNTGDIGRMKEVFGVSPMGLADGLNNYLR